MVTPREQAGFRAFFFLAALVWVLIFLTTYAGAQTGKRLILKDGTWQGITEYELRGDRARYFSSQRMEWEEVPVALVNWKATEEWNAGVNEKSPELRQFEADEEAERIADAAKRPTVAPGLKLPRAGGVFILDKFSGRPSLDALTQNGSELSNEAGHNTLHSPLNRKGTISQQFELKGPNARIQAHVPIPELFVKIHVEQREQQLELTNRFHIVRLEKKTDSRVLMRVKVGLLGQQSLSQQFVSTRGESLGEGWVKVTPLSALDPGEYALVEMLGQNEFNSFVWDFGVDSTAPANPHSWEPVTPANENSHAPE